MECLITNKICPNTVKKCKNCRLDECKDTFKVLEEAEKMWIKTKEEKFKEKLKRQYPVCAECPFLKIKDIEKEKIYCFYKTGHNCVLGLTNR